jgi:two-component system, OmpR family, response regulator
MPAILLGYDEVTPMESPALRVLVVEDDEDTATSLGMLLRLYGYDVEAAADGPSAFRAVQASPPDVVLLDIGLPKMDGWLVAKQIREQAIWKRPLLIAISGYGTQADRLRSQEVGIDLHLTKPVDPEELADLLKRFEGIVIEGPEPRSIPNAL